MPSSMTVVHFDAGRNFLEAGLDAYLVVCDSEGVTHTIPAKCGHRGGPLHLGSMDASGRFIVCPWHKNRTSVGNAVSRELPTLRTGSRISVVVGSESQSAVHPIRRTQLLDCAAALAGAARGVSGKAR